MTPDFVASLRAAVGPDHLLWLPGVNAVVKDGDGRVLLHRRSDTGEWSLLSGILDPGEDPAAGVVREVTEETGLQVVVERLAAVTVSPPIRHPHGDRAQYLELVFACRPADLRQVARVADEESLEVAWFAVDALPPVREGVRKRIALALRDEPRAWFTPAG
ncbi:NUDIX hydrolase [Actinoalloteichus fjordicus]|uniref:ADP-ribose pyrophosphatase n=1 Tax=Actinoalloteichus fjordicus TaxID=1612552 RepID=A0AAC9PSU8_9PSEU|nr:NUDIX domain-containing protein [Actinoalloteichus fjordicus]APU15201.1 ADP-ribose pyrophosphatase [Actinoalloteichus fjordicus]